jgi:hypothetical protein
LISSFSNGVIPTTSTISFQSSSVIASDVKHLIRGRFLLNSSITAFYSLATSAASGKSSSNFLERVLHF